MEIQNYKFLQKGMSIKKQFHGLSIRNAIKASNPEKSWLNKL